MCVRIFFCFQSFTSAEDSPKDVLTMLGVVDKLHDPIDGVRVGNHAFYIRLCANLQKLQVKHTFFTYFLIP